MKAMDIVFSVCLWSSCSRNGHGYYVLGMAMDFILCMATDIIFQVCPLTLYSRYGHALNLQRVVTHFIF